MTAQTEPSSLERFLAAILTASKWVEDHADELRAFAIWGTVSTACHKARLYAPLGREVWLAIIEEVRDQERTGKPEYGSIIIDSYRPGGAGFETLRQELLESELLVDRQRELGEVLDSLADGRNYVTVCGALPLIEYVISKAAGKWNHPDKYVAALQSRLEKQYTSEDDEGAIVVEYAAVEMVRKEIPNVWKSRPLRVGALVEKLNRQYVLHGTGVGWDDVANATRAVLLLAAVARVADPLFKPQSAEATTGA